MAKTEIEALRSENAALRELLATIEELSHRETKRVGDREAAHHEAIDRYSRTLDEIRKLTGISDDRRCELLEAAEGQYRAELNLLYDYMAVTN